MIKVQTGIPLLHDLEFQGKLFWRVDSEEKGIKLYQIIKEQSRRLPDFSIRFIDEGSTTGGLIQAKEDQTFVFGTRDRIEGFISLCISEPAANIGDVSKLYGLDDETLTDMDGQVVTRSNLNQHEGYDRYTGRGSVCALTRIVVFFRRQGIGSTVIDYLQAKRDFELIELEANSTKAEAFFEKQGFVRTGVNPENGEQIGMVWNNPLYSRPNEDR